MGAAGQDLPAPRAKDFLLEEGWDRAYGARHLKRAIERHLIFPLSNLMATGQIEPGDVVWADLARDDGKLIFTRQPALKLLQRSSVESTAASEHADLVDADSLVEIAAS